MGASNSENYVRPVRNKSKIGQAKLQLCKKHEFLKSYLKRFKLEGEIKGVKVNLRFVFSNAIFGEFNTSSKKKIRSHQKSTKAGRSEGLFSSKKVKKLIGWKEYSIPRRALIKSFASLGEGRSTNA